MSKDLLKELPALLKADVISEETALRIREYYKMPEDRPQNTLLIVFGILGALLTGIGIILVFAHNWDEMSRLSRTILAFFPLIAGQLACIYALLRKPGINALRESSATFLFLSIGAAISLVHQIYNLPDALLSSFLFTWMLLCAPLIFIMRSSVASLLYIAGITWFACSAGYFERGGNLPSAYWGFLLIALLHYYRISLSKPLGNFTVLHNWIIPASLTISLGTVGRHADEWLFPLYMSLFGLFGIIGNSAWFKSQKYRNSGFHLFGSIGTIFILILLSFEWFWNDLYQDEHVGENLVSPEFFSMCGIITVCSILFFRSRKKRPFSQVKPEEYIFLVFLLTFLTGYFSSGMPLLLVNCALLFLGISKIRQGTEQDHLGIMNYGLLIITALVIARFFDSDLSFVLRGILFIAVGAGFFLANNQMLKKRKANEK